MSDNDFPECEQFRDVPHRYQNCRHERLTPEQCDKWRMSQRLPPVNPLHATTPQMPRPQRKLTFLERAVSAGKAAANTLLNGFHPLSEEQIASRLAICQTCDQFDGNVCKLCGCGCNGTPTLLNKLAHPEQQCPHDPPKWGPVQ